MSYTLYESNHEKVALGKELEFLKNYIELERMRYPSDKNIQFRFPEDKALFGYFIPPLLTFTFIENAFKYGINPDEDSFVSIEISIIEKNLFLVIENSIVNLVTLDTSKSEKGIENTKKRLDVFYSGKYSLAITNNKKTFKVELKLSLDD